MLFGQIRRHLGSVFHELARRKECQIEEGHLMPDHVHMLISIPPIYSVVEVIGKSSRLFVEAVLYRFRTGCPWRDLPERFGHWKTVHQRFSRWAKGGVFEGVFKLLAEDRDNEYVMIDATIVRAHQHSAGARKKTARKPSADPAAGRAPKSTRSPDALGNPCALI
jgi:transposase